LTTLAVELRRFNAQFDRLLAFESSLADVSAAHQKLIAEVVFLRAFYVVEESVKTSALKLLCGADYLDGSVPTLLHRSRSISAAETAIANYGRPRPNFRAKWTNAVFVLQAIQHCMDPADHFATALNTHAALYEELRVIRNHIAHSTASTLTHYKAVVTRHYGAYKPIGPGTLLVSSRFAPLLLRMYLVSARVMYRDLVKA
jgi:hypothetical protein